MEAQGYAASLIHSALSSPGYSTTATFTAAVLANLQAEAYFSPSIF